VPRWLSYLDLVCAITAGGVWYASSRWWPLLIALAPWVIRFALTRRLTRRTPFDVPIALFLLTAVVGVWVAFDREAAWARFWLILGGALIFYALANAESAGGLAERQARCGSDLRVWFLTLLGAAVAVVFVLTNDWQATATKIGFLTRLGEALQAPLPRLPGPEVNANIAGAILAMLLPFAGLATVMAWQGLGATAGLRRVGAGPLLRPAISAGLVLCVGVALLLLVAFGWVMTASRGAWVAVLGALLLAGVWLVSGWLSRASLARRRWILVGCLGLGLVAALVVASVWPGATAALLGALPGPSAIGSRTELWRNSLTLVRDYPFTGLGLDGFMMAYSTYVMLLHVGFAPHAHNLYLDVAIEQGLPALLLLLVMGALFFRTFWREQTHPAAPGRRGQMAAAALSLLVVLLHGLVDDPLYKSRAVLFLFIPLAFAGSLPATGQEASPAHPAHPAGRSSGSAGWSTGPAQNAGRSTGARQAPLVVAAGVVLALTLAVICRAPLLSRAASNLGAVQQSQTELGDYTWPEWPIQDEVRRHVDLGPAVALYERALALDPGNATANRRLGQIELSLGQYGVALSHLLAAQAAEPSSQTTRQLLGEAYLANGRLVEGRALWSGVSNEQGQLDIRVWWYGYIGEKERAEWMRQAAASP
jgi:O-antigen ligase